MQQIAPGVFIETNFRRVTVGAILTNDGFVLIDTPPYPDEVRYWRDALRRISDQPILAIINTDFHRDRVLGSGWLDAGISVAHEETITYLKNLPTAFVEGAVESLAADDIERSRFTNARMVVPSVGFNRRLQVHYGGRQIHLLSMPGPTAGSIWVHLPDERLLFAGDSVVVNQHPHIASPCTKSWLDNLTVLRRPRFSTDQIVTGRGGVVEKSATEALSNYLRLARRRVQSLYRAGRPRADTSTLVPELMVLFPYQPDQVESVQRRIKAGLDRIYEEFKNNEREQDMVLGDDSAEQHA